MHSLRFDSFAEKGIEDLSKYDWFKGLSETGGIAVGALPKLTGSSRARFIGLSPIFNQSRECVGFVGALIDTKRLQELVMRVFNAHGTLAKGHLMLVTSDGRIIAHSNVKKIGAKLESVYASVTPNTAAEITLGPERMLVSRTDSPGSSWSVIGTASTHHVYRFVHALIRVLIIVTVLTFLIILLLADYLARMIVRPIRELERGAQMIGSGALDYRIELDAHSQDELGKLARSFNSMGDSLQDTQSQIRAYSRSLETAHEELDAMVYAITHDLRKSLRGIGAYTNFLGEDYSEALGENGREMLGTIKINVERITQLTDDLVGLVNAERARSDNEQFNVAEALEEVRNRMLQRHQGEILLCGGLPTVHADRKRLTLVFEHLIENGLKFNQHAVPCVEVACHDLDFEYRIDFTDNGIGIPMQEHEKVFELFYRLNPPEDYAGSGTGLNIARRIIADHRGRIDVESIVGGGTRLSVYLPKDGSRLTSPGFRVTTDGGIEHVR